MPHRPQTLFPTHAKQHPALNGGVAAFISGENPRFPAEMQGNEDLKAELDRLGLDYEETSGRYGAPGRSFIVMNPDLMTALDLGRRFGQESVAWTENGRHQLHFVNGPQAGMATNPTEGHSYSDSPPQDNYTAIPGARGEPLGYATLNIDFDNPMVPSKPTPMTEQQVEPMTKSEAGLAGEVSKWLERLGALRTRELAKAEPPPGVVVAPGVKAKASVLQALANAKRKPAASAATSAPTSAAAPTPRPEGAKFTQAPVNATMGGRAAVLGMKKDEAAPVTDSDAYFHPSEKGAPSKPAPAGPPAQNTYRNVPRDYRKSDYDPGSVHSMLQGDVSHHQSKHGGPKPVKKSDAFERANIQRVREAEQKELENIPLRTPNQGPWPSQSGKVPSIAEERQMGKSENSKVDPLDGDMARQKHLCKMCKAEMSPVEAALRKSQGSHLRCEKMAKGELKYERNEPQHGAADNAWKPSVKTVEASGSGGQTRKNPVGTSSNDGAKSTNFPMKAGAPSTHQHAGPAQTLTKGALSDTLRGAAAAGALALGTMAGPAAAAGRPPVRSPAQHAHIINYHAPTGGPMAAGTTTREADVRNVKPPMVSPQEKPPMPIIKAEVPGQGEHPAGGRPPQGPGAPGPMSVRKAEGMSTPKAPGAGMGMGGGKPAAGGSSPPKTMPLGMGKAEGSSDADMTKPPVSQAQRGAMHAAAAGKSTLGIPKSVGKEFADADQGGKLPKYKKSERELFKSIQERAHRFGTLRKALSFGGGVSTAQQGRQQQSFEAAQQTGLPAAGKVQPKSPAEYDAAAFRPATPGAAGAPSGLELDTEKKTFAPGSSVRAPAVGGMAAKPVVKQGLPIAKLGGVRGAPMGRVK